MTGATQTYIEGRRLHDTETSVCRQKNMSVVAQLVEHTVHSEIATLCAFTPLEPTGISRQRASIAVELRPPLVRVQPTDIQIVVLLEVPSMA